MYKDPLIYYVSYVLNPLVDRCRRLFSNFQVGRGVLRLARFCSSITRTRLSWFPLVLVPKGSKWLFHNRLWYIHCFGNVVYITRLESSYSITTTEMENGNRLIFFAAHAISSLSRSTLNPFLGQWPMLGNDVLYTGIPVVSLTYFALPKKSDRLLCFVLSSDNIPISSVLDTSISFHVTSGKSNIFLKVLAVPGPNQHNGCLLLLLQ